MEKRLYTCFYSLMIAGILLFPFFSIYAQDLPPATENLLYFEAGSYIIPMNEELQSIAMKNPIIDVTFTGFNVKTYGLIHHLLSNNIPVSWAIKSGKGKDETDFSCKAKVKFPVSDNTVKDYDLNTSAFIIDIRDINALLECNTLTNIVDGPVKEFGNDILVLELTEDVYIDIRYRLNFAPKIAVLNDGFSSYVHQNVLEEAEIPFTLISSFDFFKNYSCYTFISQPHLDFISNSEYVPSVQNFLDEGGNFFAQCIAVTTFENDGFFQSSDGFSQPNQVNLTYDFFNHDMAPLQFKGSISPDLHGSLDEYILKSNSDFINESYIGIKNQNQQICMSVADLNGSTAGGNIFYLSGHDFEGTDLAEIFGPPTADISDQLIKNQQHKRIYLNSVFVPANISFACAGKEACICKGDSVTLGCDKLNLNSSYTWSPAEGLSCTDCPHPVASPETTTTYTQTTDNDCSSSSVTVHIDEVPHALIQGGEILDCMDENDLATLEVLLFGTPPFTFVIARNGQSVDTIFTDEETYSLEVSESGIYTLLEVKNFKCSGVVSGDAEITKPVSFSFDLGKDKEGCPGETFILDATHPDAISYIWQDGSIDSIYEASQEGWYKVSLANEFGCIETDSVFVSLLPVLDNLDLGEDLNLCNVEQLVLEASMANADQYIWNTGSDKSSITVTQSGDYSVTVSNVCDTLSDEINIVFRKGFEGEAFQIPSAFSPNGDGLNDVFIPFVHSDAIVNSLLFKVYDRWGNPVFETGKVNTGWDGLKDAIDAELGVYVWFLKANVQVCEGRIDVFEKGNVSLIR